MFTDGTRRSVQDEIRQHDLRAYQRFLTHDVIQAAARRAGVKIGDSPLHLGNLVWLGIAGAMHTAKSFADILAMTLSIICNAENYADSLLGRMEQKVRQPKKPQKKPKKSKKQKSLGRKGTKKRKSVSKHNPHGRGKTDVSEEAFVQARKRMPWTFWMALLIILADKCGEQHATKMRWKRFRLLALDGTTINLPRSRRLEKYFGSPSNGTKKRKKGVKPVPQARMVMLQSPLTRIPIRFELSPLKVAEQTLAYPLCEHLVRNDLVLMDRGFWSFGLFWEIQKRNAFFGIRLKAKVNFQTIRRLGPGDRIVRHTPKDSRGKWRQQGYNRSIELRVIDYQIPGFQKSSIVTNVLDPRAISREDWVGLAVNNEPGRNLTPGLYHRRWEIETTFRELKVEQGMEGHLRGRTPEAIRFEIAGHVLLYLLTRWLILEAAVSSRQDPLRLSFKKALGALHDMHQLLIVSSSKHVSEVLLPRLLQNIARHVVPLRPGRHYPRPKDTETKNKGYGHRQRPSKLKTKPRTTTQKKAA